MMERREADLGDAKGKPVRRLADALAWQRSCPYSAPVSRCSDSRRGRCRDYGYLRASILTGSHYYALASRPVERAKREHGQLTVIPTAGSIENIRRLSAPDNHCAEIFALVQDGTPVPADARLELLGRLPEPESLLLLARKENAFHTFSDLRGASIGIGPEGSGTVYLMRQLFDDPDLRALDVHATLLIAGPCSKRADRVALLMLRGASPGFTSAATKLPLATSAHQFFLTGEPELADRYFPWLVNLMSPAYWIHLAMAVTVIFNMMKTYSNMMKTYSRFRLWRIDAAREKSRG
jgi:hypothetical protein